MSAATAIRVVIPTCPDAVLSPNYHGNWRPRAKAARALRELTYWECPRIEAPLQGDVLISARIGWPKGRRIMDNSNAAAALKSLVDGLTDGGWWLDDQRVNVIVVEQLTWGKQDAGTRATYPHGFISIDVQEESS